MAGITRSKTIWAVIIVLVLGALVALTSIPLLHRDETGAPAPASRSESPREYRTEPEPREEATPSEPGASAPDEAVKDDAPVTAPPPPPPPPPPSPVVPAPEPQAPPATESEPRPADEGAASPPDDSEAPGSLGQAPPSGGAPGPDSDQSVDDRDFPNGTAGRTMAKRAAPPPASTAAPSPAASEANKTYDVVPVFYGTDRAAVPDPKRLQYGSDRGRKLVVGRAMVTVPLEHKVPNIERPWVVEIPYFKVKLYEEKEDPAKHFTIQEIAAMSKDELLALVRERLAKSATFKDHAFVFVHGFNTSFDAAIYRTAQIAYDLKFDGAPFVYAWPSGGKVASYTYDRGSAEQSEPYLAEFLNLVIKQTGAKSISLIAHSMGNELLLRVLERMQPEVPGGVEISEVIFAAPDVDRDKFGNIASQITRFAKGVTLYAASNDKALGYSARFWGGVPRAGDVPATGPLLVPGVDTIDVTSVSTDSLGLNHSGYAENSALLADIKQLLQTGKRPPESREPKLKKIESSAGVFWRYQTAP